MQAMRDSGRAVLAWTALVVLLLNAASGYGLAQPPAPVQQVAAPLGDFFIVCTPSGTRVLPASDGATAPQPSSECQSCPCCAPTASGFALPVAVAAPPAPRPVFLSLRPLRDGAGRPGRQAWLLPASRAPPACV